MSDAFVQPPPNTGTGPKVDTEEILVGANIVERQRNRIGGLGAAELVDVRNAQPASNDYGVVTRIAAPNVDTGFQAVTSVALVEANGIDPGDAFLLDGLLVANSSGIMVDIEVTDGAGEIIMPRMGWPGGVSQALPFHAMPITGLKFATPGGGTVVFKAWGRK